MRRVAVLSAMPLLRRFLAGAVLATVSSLRADVTPAPLFTDHAVLQREQPLPIWGRAAPGEKVTVTFAGQTRMTTTAGDGRWVVLLDPLLTNAQGADLTIVGHNSLVVHDVLVGEVWLCSGQSNMEFRLDQALNAQQEIAAANFPLIRHVKIARTVAERPADTVETTGWQPASPQTAGKFTAVGYFFARDLYQKLGIPIGLVNSSWGGTPIESWLSPAALASDPSFHVVAERWAQDLAAYSSAKPVYDRWLADWRKGEADAKARGEKAHQLWLDQHPWQRAPRGPGDSWTPSGLYNGMINPLAPYAMRGVLWYQGESNADRAEEYRAMFGALITTWRGHFGQPDALPFYWVNLANFRATYETRPDNWPWLREAQTQTLALPRTGQAITIDIGAANDIHPTDKQDVGRRLALLAKHRLYANSVDDTGPMFAGAVREGRNLRVRFTNVGGGLVAHDRPPQSLEVAGADRVFHPATGRVERDTLIVSSAEVKEPIAVRYAWSNAPDANLYNGAGLPAVPFRSDDWPRGR
jgi:sialate O-acetylesterase